MGYVILFLIKGELPWMNIPAITKEEKQRKILESK